MNKYPDVLSATTMIGNKIMSPDRKKLGTLKELMIDLDTGSVSYAVLSFGGFLGLGNKLFAIPWEALTLHMDEHAFVLNVKKEDLADAPGFDKDNWPDEAQYTFGWLVALYDYYGYSPYWITVNEEPERYSRG